MTGAALAGGLHAQQRGVNVLDYSFAIELPDSGTAIAAAAAVRFEQLPGYDDTLRLNLVGMTVERVLDPETGRRLDFGQRDGVLWIAIRRGASRSRGVAGARIEYRGSPGDGLIIRTNARGRPSFFGDNWPNRARYWLPTVDHPSDKAAVRWEIGAPAGMEVVANGRLIACSAGSDGRTRWVYREDRPIPTYTMVIGATDMAVSSHRPLVRGADTIPVTVWTYPEDSAFADSVPFRRSTAVLEVMERLVGPYPYRNLAHVQSSTRYGGMENSTAIFYAEGAYVRRSMREGVVRHETAHQWFGDAVTPADWPHLWLSEGFASYFDLVVGASLDGDSLLARGMRASAAAIVRSSATSRPVLDTAESDPNNLLNTNSYQKGAWVLHMLRGLVGDSAFFRGIRTYYGRFRDSSVTTDQFRRVMEEAAGGELRWFFDQWLRQPGFPQLEVTWRHISEGGRRGVQLAVRQAQPQGWGRYRIDRVPVALRLPGGSTMWREFSLEREPLEQQVTFWLDRELPDEVVLDPEVTLLLASVMRREPS
ncbi:MAG TPA: M1 family metallopeptidase [Gemmatimonadales bacterium]|nr:M1 family metallopeptidase [Gemmatimonadales bacterium]